MHRCRFMELGDWTEAFKASLLTEKQAGDGVAEADAGGNTADADASAWQRGKGTRAKVARWAKGEPPSGEGGPSSP